MARAERQKKKNENKTQTGQGTTGAYYEAAYLYDSETSKMK